GVLITGITEKPIKRYFINAGIYLLNPDVCQQIPHNEFYDMPSLIQKLISQGGKVVSFPIHEYWLDVGKHPDYQKAMDDFTHETSIST
ncbi:sugar phosphate nucleotidyltransferase, partial [Arthrospira platensis SPKY1]|nr:sugar phosphate nucleotidyltransferase [Arthrospira platensis SPKY1]